MGITKLHPSSCTKWNVIYGLSFADLPPGIKCSPTQALLLSLYVGIFEHIELETEHRCREGSYGERQSVFIHWFSNKYNKNND